MKNNNQQAGIIGWSARITGIVFAAFLSIFSLDVFSEGYNFTNTLLALFMHLIPAMIVILILVVSWQREWIGAIAFLIVGIFYVYLSWGRIAWSGSAIITIPLFALATLFFISWYRRRQSRS